MPFDDVDASVPIWLSARVAGPDGLAAAIESAAAGIGDVRRTGAVVILDGADEVGARRQGGGRDRGPGDGRYGRALRSGAVSERGDERPR
jgi:hypothetical protein